jgi:hypothetical protein
LLANLTNATDMKNVMPFILFLLGSCSQSDQVSFNCNPGNFVVWYERKNKEIIEFHYSDDFQYLKIFEREKPFAPDANANDPVEVSVLFGKKRFLIDRFLLIDADVLNASFWQNDDLICQVKSNIVNIVEVECEEKFLGDKTSFWFDREKGIIRLKSKCKLCKIPDDLVLKSAEGLGRPCPAQISGLR